MTICRPGRLEEGVARGSGQGERSFSQRREHSRKPDEFYDTIRRVTFGPRIDVFGRERREGFEVWGNEPDRFNEAAE
jgi:N6-adenosine-specific RNA methylase IME4